ncbi:MAG: STAS domain-containing protein [Oligoflexia bacterium]|nr:STAS domain-containing protein [Oligoflexia bacterium]
MINIIKNDKKIVVQVDGDILATNVEIIRVNFKNILSENNFDEFVIDLLKTTMVDSVGIGLLVATHNSLEKIGKKLLVRNVSSELLILFKSMRIEQHFSISGMEK